MHGSLDQGLHKHEQQKFAFRDFKQAPDLFSLGCVLWPEFSGPFPLFYCIDPGAAQHTPDCAADFSAQIFATLPQTLQNFWISAAAWLTASCGEGCLTLWELPLTKNKNKWLLEALPQCLLCFDCSLLEMAPGVSIAPLEGRQSSLRDKNLGRGWKTTRLAPKLNTQFCSII